MQINRKKNNYYFAKLLLLIIGGFHTHKYKVKLMI